MLSLYVCICPMICHYILCYSSPYFPHALCLDSTMKKNCPIYLDILQGVKCLLIYLGTFLSECNCLESVVLLVNINKMMKLRHFVLLNFGVIILGSINMFDFGVPWKYFGYWL